MITNMRSWRGRSRQGRVVLADTDFSMVIEGSAVDDHLIPVRDLAPALLALGEMFHDANRLFNPPEAEVTLSIRATDAGSFEVHLVLSTVADWSTLFNSDVANSLINLKELIIGGAAGVFWLIRRINKRRVVDQQPSGTDPSRTRITLADGTVIDAPSDTVKLYNETRTKRLAAEVVAPLDRDGVERIRFESADIQTTVSISEGEVGAFAADGGDLSNRRLVNTEVGSVALTLESVPLIDGLPWRVNDGDSSHRARMADEAFTTRVVSQAEAFTAGDYLLARVRRDQYQNVDTGRLSNEWTIERVERHVPAVETVEQPTLSPASDDLLPENTIGPDDYSEDGFPDTPPPRALPPGS